MPELDKSRLMTLAAGGRTLPLVHRYGCLPLSRKRAYLPSVGSCTVLEKRSDIVYMVQLVKQNRVVVLHQDRLTHHFGRT